MNCLPGAVISPNNWGTVLHSTAHKSTAILDGTTHVGREASKPAISLPQNNITVGYTGNIWAWGCWRNIFHGLRVSLKFWCTDPFLEVVRVWNATGTIWIRLLELFRAEKSSARSPNPVYSMKMPWLVEIWLRYIEKYKWVDEGSIEEG